MRLDHLSYAAPSGHLADVVQRLGSRLGAGFTDGGVHPRFGTRNFVLFDDQLPKILEVNGGLLGR